MLIPAEKLRSQIPFFIEDEEFGPMISPEIAAALVRISPRQIEQPLAGHYGSQLIVPV
jgi:hypothetical protein